MGNGTLTLEVVSLVFSVINTVITFIVCSNKRNGDAKNETILNSFCENAYDKIKTNKNYEEKGLKIELRFFHIAK